MGNSHSSGQVLSKGPPQVQQPLEPPYPGPQAQYTFVNTEVTLAAKISFGFLSSPMITSNVEAYYPLLAQPYEQGYRMLTFYHIPMQAKSTGFLQPGIRKTYQGVFCRYPQVPSNERYQLRIEKSVIQPQIVFNGFITTRSDTVTDTSHLYQTIANNTQNGGRLICIELTGQQQATPQFSLTHRVMPTQGVDLFFEYPLSGPGEIYTYNVVCAPIMVSYSAGLRPTPVVQCDWNGILAQNLGQGYRLVEIFMDETQTTQQQGFASAVQQMNSQWFFEKPASRAHDPTPVYQGTVVQFEVKMSQGFNGMNCTANWEPVIQEMGNKGWELACFLETPEMRFSGLSTVYTKVLIFFQRKIIY